MDLIPFVISVKLCERQKPSNKLQDEVPWEGGRGQHRLGDTGCAEVFSYNLSENQSKRKGW